jgi:hypothetical protein
MEAPPGAAPPPTSRRDSHCLGYDVPPRSPSHRPVVVHSLKPPRRVAGWIFGRWVRRGSGASKTRRCLETWGSIHCVKRRTPSQSSSIADNHGGCAVHLCDRCTVRRVDRGGREA